MKKIIWLVILLISLTSFSQNQIQMTKIDSIVNNSLAENDPGIMVGIVKDGQVIYEEYRGLSYMQYQIKMDEKTKSNIASIAKQFTALMILDLALNEKLNLEDDIRVYLPSLYKSVDDIIRIRHVLNHTSGIREQDDLLRLSGTKLTDVTTNDEVFRLVTSQKETNFETGSQYEYCNSAFMLLTKMVERISGDSFGKFTQERIFVPLNMKNSFFLDDTDKVIKNRVYSYSPFGNGYQKNLLNSSVVGSTGL
ncbi:MAG: serine hydrolase domain-containing protein, partial [Cyclobacteriaceae bacterium]